MLETVRFSGGRRDYAERPAGEAGESPPRRTYGGAVWRHGDRRAVIARIMI